MIAGIDEPRGTPRRCVFILHCLAPLVGESGAAIKQVVGHSVGGGGIRDPDSVACRVISISDQSGAVRQELPSQAPVQVVAALNDPAVAQGGLGGEPARVVQNAFLRARRIPVGGAAVQGVVAAFPGMPHGVRQAGEIAIGVVLETPGSAIGRDMRGEPAGRVILESLRAAGFVGQPNDPAGGVVAGAARVAQRVRALDQAAFAVVGVVPGLPGWVADGCQIAVGIVAENSGAPGRVGRGDALPRAVISVGHAYAVRIRFSEQPPHGVKHIRMPPAKGVHQVG